MLRLLAPAAMHSCKVRTEDDGSAAKLVNCIYFKEGDGCMFSHLLD
jgi:hypothetical protein